jgi:hypothetical protein
MEIIFIIERQQRACNKRSIPAAAQNIGGSLATPGLRTCDRNVYLRFQVFTVASLTIKAFWYIAPCSLVEVDRRFSTSETSGYFYETTQRYIPEGCHLQKCLSLTFLQRTETTDSQNYFWIT